VPHGLGSDGQSGAERVGSETESACNQITTVIGRGALPRPKCWEIGQWAGD
jgi:hypothetical protein